MKKRVRKKVVTFDVERTHSFTDWSRDSMGQSIDQRINGSLDAYLASPADFAGAFDIIINLAKKKEPDQNPFSDVRPK